MDVSKSSSLPVLASLGMSCQCAHQLARYADAHPDTATFRKGPFDWLICPPESAVSWLESGLEPHDVSQFEIIRDKPYWPRHDLFVWHGYTWRDGETRKLDIPRTAQREAEKLNHQRAQFLALNPADTIFIVSNVQNNLEGAVFATEDEGKYIFDAPRMERLKAALDATFASDTRLVVITRADRWTGPRSQLCEIVEITPGDSEWKGEDTAWDIALDRILGADD